MSIINVKQPVSVAEVSKSRKIKSFHFYWSKPGAKPEVGWLNQQKSLVLTLYGPHNTGDLIL